MSDAKCGKLILDAIDQLRKRKARPDFDRISHMLERRHGLKGPAVTEELARLVNEGAVIKVDYKGNTSYRNAAKWVKTKTQFFGGMFTPADMSSVVLEAVFALNDDAKARGVSLRDVEQYLLKRDSQSHLNQATLRAILEKEVTKRTIQQLATGEFVPMKNISDTSGRDKIAAASGDNQRKNTTSPTAKRLKVSDAGTKIIKSDPTQPLRCDYCLLTATANRKGHPEELLICKDCSAKAHPSCMEYTKLLYEKFPNPHKWQCPDCKICVACEESCNSNEMLTCYICFNGYHMKCHTPVINEKPLGTWLCFECDRTTKEIEEKPKIKHKHVSSSSEDDTVYDKPASQSIKEEFRKSIENYPKRVPAAKKWTIENVEAFFRFIGFEDEAMAFREQEIDGLSLLLMKRNDVLTGLGIKLGPALKIYKHVRNLQSFIGDS